MSGAPIISGTNQLPKPPINAGMIMKNTMIKPCADTTTLKNWKSVPKTCIPGTASSMRMRIENTPPTTPEAMANRMYMVPMSLWLVE